MKALNIITSVLVKNEADRDLSTEEEKPMW